MKTTENKINPRWPHNLWEVGNPIASAADRIAYQIEDAEKELAEAKARYCAAMAGISESQASLEKECLKYWTSEQIAAAKKGKTLCDDGVIFDGATESEGVLC